MKKVVIIIAIILVAILLIIGTYRILTMPVSKNITEKQVEIPMGSGTSKIAEILKKPFGTIRKLCYGERCKDILREYRDKAKI